MPVSRWWQLFFFVSTEESECTSLVSQLSKDKLEWFYSFSNFLLLIVRWVINPDMLTTNHREPHHKTLKEHCSLPPEYCDTEAEGCALGGANNTNKIIAAAQAPTRRE